MRTGSPTATRQQSASAAGWLTFYVPMAVLFSVVIGLIAGWGLGAQSFAHLQTTPPPWFLLVRGTYPRSIFDLVLG
ncbi:MAG TPA: hypothetical protein VIK04_06440 [Solirubrobacteraceae bacterium]